MVKMAPKKRQYAKEDFEKALKYIREEEASIRQASKRFGVPRTSLQFKLSNPDSRFKSGPTPVLTSAEEEALTDFIIQLAKQGFPRNKDDIQDQPTIRVQRFLEENPRPNPFKNGRPGDAWFEAFMKRHPNIAFRTSEGCTNASACVAEQDIRKWFREIQEFIEREGLTDVIEDPTRLFNADETGFNICPKTGKVLAEKGSRNVLQVEKGSSKENLTVMFTFSAAGSTYKPMIIYPYTRIPDRIGLSVPAGWGIGRSEKGWMTAAVFKELIENCFYPQLLTNGVIFPVILFVDGHKTHVTIEVAEVCRNLKIHLIALYPNATRILQPADVAAFQPIKAGWKKGLRKWHSVNRYAVNLTRETFAPLLKDVVETTAKKETLVNGFRVCGLYPFNADNVDYTKCLAEKEKVNPANGDIPTVERNVGNEVNYIEFCSIVGESVIEDCQKARCSNVENNNPYFQAIYRIWVKFNDTEERNNDDNEKLHALTAILPKEAMVADVYSVEYQRYVTHDVDEEQGEILDEITGEITQLNKNKRKVDICTLEDKKNSQYEEPRTEPSNGDKITIANGMADVHSVDYQSRLIVTDDGNEEQDEILDEVTGEVTHVNKNKRKADICILEEMKITHYGEPRTELPNECKEITTTNIREAEEDNAVLVMEKNVVNNIIPQTSQSFTDQNASIGIALSQVQEHRNLIRVVSNISMAEFLDKQKPIRPKRKGKRQTEKLPFALTSDSYVDIIRAKQVKKRKKKMPKKIGRE